MDIDCPAVGIISYMSGFRKYRLNPETLLYEIEKVSAKSRLLKMVMLVSASIALSCVYLWLFTSVLGMELPKTTMLRKTNARWISKVELMNKQLDISWKATTVFRKIKKVNWRIVRSRIVYDIPMLGALLHNGKRRYYFFITENKINRRLSLVVSIFSSRNGKCKYSVSIGFF